MGNKAQEVLILEVLFFFVFFLKDNCLLKLIFVFLEDLEIQICSRSVDKRLGFINLGTTFFFIPKGPRFSLLPLQLGRCLLQYFAIFSHYYPSDEHSRNR